MRSEQKENKNYKIKDSISPKKITPHESTKVHRDSEADIVEGGYWH